MPVDQACAKKVLGGVGGAVTIVTVVALTLGTATAARLLGLWAYPVFFGINMALSSLVLLIPEPVKTLCRLFPWLGWLIRWVAKAVSGSGLKHSSPFWLRVRRYGGGWLTTASTVVGGPIIGAGTVRLMNLNQRKTWKYIIIANVVATVLWMSFYLGMWGMVKSLFGW